MLRSNEGKATSVAVPLGPQYSYGYNSMGRPLTITHTNTAPPASIISDTAYGPAGELLGITGLGFSETRTYNDRLQLTNITGGGRNINYNYDNAANNGQLFSQVENGETVAYQYDSLKRLISATASGSTTWTQSYGYDGFGNLLSKTGSGNGGGGGPVSASYTINSATNRPFSGYTAAGLPTNSGFDNDNRMISTVSTTGYSEYFAYSPGGKRVWNLGERQIDAFTQETVQEVWFWSPQGQRLAFYSLTHAGAPVFTFKEANVYLGGKLLGQYKNFSFLSWGHVLQTSDRLGSFGKYYPYGEERNPTGASGEKFATYFHDANVGMNYADQRWHGTWGRFATPDPYQPGAGSGRWNLYEYADSDPVGRNDPLGLFGVDPPSGPGVPPPILDPGPDPNQPGGGRGLTCPVEVPAEIRSFLDYMAENGMITGWSQPNVFVSNLIIEMPDDFFALLQDLNLINTLVAVPRPRSGNPGLDAAIMFVTITFQALSALKEVISDRIRLPKCRKEGEQIFQNNQGVDMKKCVYVCGVHVVSCETGADKSCPDPIHDGTWIPKDSRGRCQ